MLRGNLGTRLIYLRRKLKLVEKEVYIPLEISQTSYQNAETGYEQKSERVLKLVEFFDKLWQEKYGKLRSYPKAYDEILEEITVSWLMFGHDKVLKRANEFTERVSEDFRQRELELLNSIRSDNV